MRRSIYFLWYVFIFCIPLSIRLFFGSATQGFHEYESFFLYASDIVLAALIGSFLLYKKRRIFHIVKKRSTLFWLSFLFVAFSFLSLFFATSEALSIYTFLRFLLLIFFAMYIVPFVWSDLTHRVGTLVVIALAGVIQAGIGIVQFFLQHSLGLSFLGESPLSVLHAGTSTIGIGGAKVLRAYGTFPHPNILSLFLVLALLSLAYLYIAFDVSLYHFEASASLRYTAKRFFQSGYFWARLVVAALFFLVVIGLVLTFSRAGWIVGFMSVGLFVLFNLFVLPRPTGRFLLLALVAAVAAYGLFQPFIAPRALALHTGEPSVDYRLEYAKMGLDLVQTRPLGVGLGNQVLYSVTHKLYQARGLTQAWEWEPVHNIYLLAAIEVGVFGGALFIVFLLYLLVRLFSRTRSLERSFVLAVFGGVLTFGLFDHFLWDLQPGRLMFWLVIGMVFSQVLLLPKQEVYH